MRLLNQKRIVISLITIFCSLVYLVLSVNADGTETLGVPSINIASGSGFVIGGTGLEKTTPAIISLEVPENSTIKQVLAYWSGATREGTPGDNEIIINGIPITGQHIGTGPGQKLYESYRADITALELVSTGANTLSVAGMSFIAENDGAGIIVIYEDDNGLSELKMVDGLDIAYINRPEPGQTTVPQTFTFAPEDVDRVAEMGFFVGSVLRERPNVIRFHVAGEIIEHFNLLSSAQGLQWDALKVPVNIPAGASEITVEIQSESDGTDRLPASLTWINATLSVPITPIANCVDFSTLTPGSSVEGPGTVHPLLDISTSGNSIVLTEGRAPIAYVATNDAPIWNGGLTEGGFYDRQEIHDYVFTLAPDAHIGYFTLRVLDYGDFNPVRASKHEIMLVAYDADNNIIDTDKLMYTSENKFRPRVSSMGDLWFTGDAIAAINGEPGNYTFAVAGDNIARVELKFANDVDSSRVSDPKFAIAGLCFTPPPPPPVCMNFAALTPGSSVQGLGTVHPNLDIETSGNAIALMEGRTPIAYVASNTAGVWNGGVGSNGGFYDQEEIHDYSFTFSPDISSDYFSLRLLDYGDYNPLKATEHEIKLVGFDENGQIVAARRIMYTSEGKIRPRAGSMGDLWFTGDAKDAAEGDIGNYLFELKVPGISRVELQFSNNIDSTIASDPKFGIGDLCFNPINK